MSVSENDLVARAQGRLGTVLRGKYRLDSVLGIGGMAVVYAATHRNKKRFAVKMLHPELSIRPEIRNRFLREGYAANSVDHPDAVAVLDDDVDEAGAAFLVMELLEGESAETLWERSGERLPLPVAIAIAHRALDVLADAHTHGVVHRDVKPANLFLTRRGEVKLLDFGVARVRDVASSQPTLTGAIMGTAAFMAPEQAMGKIDDIDAATDVWAVGATIFNLASGRFVHEGENAQETVVLSATRPAPSLRSVLPDAPPAVVHAVDRALAFARADRWSSAAAMRDALRDASVAAYGELAALPGLPDRVDHARSFVATPLAFDPGPSPATTAVPPPVRSPRRAAMLAGGASAIVGVVVLVARERSPAADPSSAVTAPTAAGASPSTMAPPVIAIPNAGAEGDAAAPRTRPSNPRPIPAGKAPASGSSPSPLGSRCVPPFFFDAQGNRIFKKECL